MPAVPFHRRGAGRCHGHSSRWTVSLVQLPCGLAMTPLPLHLFLETLLRTYLSFPGGAQLATVNRRVRPISTFVPLPKLVGNHLADVRRWTLNSGLEFDVSPAPDSESRLGTCVSPLSAKPSPPVVSGPTVRVAPEQTVSFTCKSHGFSPRNISLKWFKNGNELSASQTDVEPEGNNVSYSISSTTKVVLAPGDVRSQVICEVTHITLQGDPPLRGTANLSETIRGRSPSRQPKPTPVLKAPACSSSLLFAPGLKLPGISFLTVLPHHQAPR
ncbi:signal-regulatory protein beta-1-like [Neophocaena asiaeorientalis asiaeorientalis]|uniref:Signal-regulatory protein beta-1-like n=1 Tax=Neophocaena asiaeorientalis asiaeorientalis TaxID=1706337 RepID=A0A341AHK8_NEOAA|nr:signal-regulatory protein beta-1-like [Neophocaena asiaeorientalis asiaeorientalis]